MDGNWIRVRSLDLSADWATIKEQLDNIAKLV
jgi:hypothetical protein